MSDPKPTYQAEHSAMLSVYQEHGFADRDAYLADLALNTRLEPEIVQTMADVLGPSEDFDGLVTTLEDIAETPSP